MDRRWARIPALTVASGILALSVAQGAAPRTRPSGLDDRLVRFEGRAIGVLPRSTESLAPSDPLRVGWSEFRDRHAGDWKVYIDERSGLPSLVQGSGIEWFPEQTRGAIDLATLQATARTFLLQERELLGSWGGTLSLDHAASGKIRPDHWQLVFRQVIDGVQVENSRLDFHVVRGRLVMFGASFWSAPRISGVPSIGPEEAAEALRSHLGLKWASLHPIGEGELTILAVDAEPLGTDARVWTGTRGAGLGHVLLWRFKLQEAGVPTLWIGEVDASDGSIRSFRDGTDYASVRGGVFPISNDGDCTAGGCEIARFPMPFGDYDEQGQVTTVTDVFGNLQCVDDGAALGSRLSGPYVIIDDVCGPSVESGTCIDGVDFGIKRGENCDVDPLASAGNTAAARTAFYHMNRAAEVGRFYDPGNSWMQSPLTINVNYPGTCNAFWNGEITTYDEGDGCGNMGELSGILIHEWGHGHDQNDGGGFDSPNEAAADIIAILAARDSCMGRGWYSDGSTCSGYGNACLTCTGIRELDWAAREWNEPSSVLSFVNSQCDGGGIGPCGREAHCEGYVAGETIYDLVVRDLPAQGVDLDTAWQIVERLWYVTRIGSGGNMYLCIVPNTYGCSVTNLFPRFLVADDDDGDLSNGTPHAAAIYAAFKRHRIACGSASDPEHQNNSSCPVLAAPALTLNELPGGTELSWAAVAGAGEYRVYRGDLGCDRQQIPVASLTGGETSWIDSVSDPGLPRYYRVEVIGTNSACSSPVSNCAVTPAGARLQMSDFRFIEPSGNGLPDPGENVGVAVSLFNSGLDDAAGVTGLLELADPAQGDVTDPSAGWTALPSNSIVESDPPHFQVEVAESVECGSVLAFDLELSAANAATQQHRFSVQLGDPERDFINGNPTTIPPDPGPPVTSTIEIDQDRTVSELDVSVRITQSLREELIVELTSPQNTTVRLHDQNGAGFGIDTRYDLETAPSGPGTMGDFTGETTLGTWTLSVQDVGTASSGDGKIYEWTLHVGVDGAFDCLPHACEDPAPANPVLDLRVDRQRPAGQPRLEFDWGSLAEAAGYHVLRSTVPAFDQGVELVGQTDAATTTLTVDDLAGADLTFYQVRGINSCGEEGP